MFCLSPWFIILPTLCPYQVAADFCKGQVSCEIPKEISLLISISTFCNQYELLNMIYLCRKGWQLIAIASFGICSTDFLFKVEDKIIFKTLLFNAEIQLDMWLRLVLLQPLVWKRLKLGYESIFDLSFLRIQGTTAVEITSGLHWYLKYRCGAHISWEKTGGVQLASVPKPGSLPLVEAEGVTIQRPVPWNYYQNVVTSSCKHTTSLSLPSPNNLLCISRYHIIKCSYRFTITEILVVSLPPIHKRWRTECSI